MGEKPVTTAILSRFEKKHPWQVGERKKDGAKSVIRGARLKNLDKELNP